VGWAGGALEPRHARLAGNPAALAAGERLPAYAPELNPVEYLWSNLKGVELANFAGDTVLEVVDTAERGVRRVCDDQQLAWSFLAHTGLTLDHQPPPNL
jgi:transposase